MSKQQGGHPFYDSPVVVRSDRIVVKHSTYVLECRCVLCSLSNHTSVAVLFANMWDTSFECVECWSIYFYRNRAVELFCNTKWDNNNNRFGLLAFQNWIEHQSWRMSLDFGQKSGCRTISHTRCRSSFPLPSSGIINVF